MLVPSVGDNDIDWDNELDLDEDISEEEMKKIMESLGNSDLGKLGDLEVEDVSEKQICNSGDVLYMEVVYVRAACSVHVH